MSVISIQRRVGFGVGCALLAAAGASAQAPLYDLFSVTAGDSFGSSVTGLGDVDGDGVGDLAVGARTAAGLQPQSGVVHIYSGKLGNHIRQINGERTGDNFGYRIDALGDIDGDGFGDIVVGAPTHEWTTGTNRGAVYTFSGATGAQLGKLGGTSDSDQLGWAVSGVPDVNLDGVPDYAFSKPWGDSSGFTDNGVVYIYSGAAPTTLLRSYSGAATGDHFGYALDGATDMNSDGRGDLLIGAPQADAAGFFDSGRGYLASGAASGSFISTYSGTANSGWFGQGVACLPDMTGDGRAEAVFGEPFVTVSGISGCGRVRAYSGSNGAIVREILGEAQDNIGWFVAGIPDFDGDARGDIVVGVHNAEWPPYTNAGLAKVYSGATGAMVAAMTGYHSNENFGQAVAGAGDLNGDGFQEVIAGSPSYDGEATDAGRARIMFGNAPWPTAYCTGKTNSQGCDPYVGIGGCASATIGDNLQIVGVNVLPHVNGIMIWSLNQAATPFFGGTLCVGAPIHRTPVQTASENVGGSLPCDGVYVYHFSHAKMAAEGLTPGMDFSAQYWSRDNGFAAPNNIGLTNGVNIQILP